MVKPTKQPQDTTTEGRPVRANRGIGGQRVQLEKTAAIVGQDLLSKVTGQKRSRNNVANLPGNLPENDLAPPIPTKRQKTTRPPSIRTEPPLQARPSPVLTIRQNGSLYGFPVTRRALVNVNGDHTGRGAVEAVDNGKDHYDDDNYNANNDDNNNDNNNDNDNDNDKDNDEDDYTNDNNEGNDNRNGGDNDDGNSGDDEEEEEEGLEYLDDQHAGGYSQAPDDFPIDEVSPSEDERAALDVIRQKRPSRYIVRDSEDELPRNVKHRQKNSSNRPPRLTADTYDGEEETLEVTHDVLAQHRKSNPSNRPPQLNQLSVAATRQENNHQPNTNDVDVQAGDESEPPEIVQTRASRHSRSTGEARPDTLKYYKGTSWNSILENAKTMYRRHIALYHGFPERDTDLGDATKLVAEAIAKFENDDGILDSAHQHNRDMDCLVFKEGATFRGKLKSIALHEVEKVFKDELDPPDMIESQRDRATVIERNVAGLLERGKFLQDGKDDLGRTNNLANPCLRRVCIKLFYSSKNPLARSFPADFKTTIPDRAIALVATAIKHALNQYASGTFIDSKFEGIHQCSVYDRMLSLIDQVKADPYHGAKYNAVRGEWAKAGMKYLEGPSQVETHDLDVILD